MHGNPISEFMCCDVCSALWSVIDYKPAHLFLLISKLLEQLEFQD
ncbi:MAG: hypothetical protein ACLQO6_13635 [Desulfomonilaceae bacterium]